MSTIRIKRRSKADKLHCPVMLAVKKACRALGVSWSDITAERDRLRMTEIDERDHSEEARRVAWGCMVRRQP